MDTLSNADIAQIMELERHRQCALIERDYTALGSLHLDEFTYTHSSGITQDKAAYLAHAPSITYLDIARDGVTVTLYGNAAVMTGRLTNRLIPKGGNEAVAIKLQVLQVWMKSAEGWRIAAFQATRLPEN